MLRSFPPRWQYENNVRSRLAVSFRRVEFTSSAIISAVTSDAVKARTISTRNVFQRSALCHRVGRQLREILWHKLVQSCRKLSLVIGGIETDGKCGRGEPAMRQPEIVLQQNGSTRNR